MKNKIMTSRKAISLVRDGHRVMVGSFGLRGYPEDLVKELAITGRKRLTIISNDLGAPGEGLGQLLRNNQIEALVGNYYNWNPEVAEAYNRGDIQVELLPQGTFAEAIRAAGAGIPGFYTKSGVGTTLCDGKETMDFDGKTYVLERAIGADVALIKAYKADELGNLVYYKTARNFNPVMATAANITIAQVEEIVPTGALDPECIATPRIFVDAIVVKEGGDND